jgi:tetratricopeptide (TPR) repeat protein
MTEGYRRLDRQLGAASVFDDCTHHLQRLVGLKDASMATEHRQRLAAAAGEVASLAAWQALDLGRPGAAWSYYCLASRAAREAGHRELHAYVIAETSYVLLFGGQVREALSLVKRARYLARGATPRLRAWLAAAHAEAAAIAGNAADTLRALDQADEAFQRVEPGSGPRWLSYFDQTHLIRWKGHCLVLVGQPETALAVLQEALDSVDASFVRARAGALVDLATLHLQQGESTRPATFSGTHSGWRARRSPARTSGASSSCADTSGPGTRRRPSGTWTSYSTGSPSCPEPSPLGLRRRRGCRATR